MWRFKLLLLGHSILSTLDLHLMSSVGSVGWGYGLHSRGVLCLDSAQSAKD